jgi:hypothetical protein
MHPLQPAGHLGHLWASLSGSLKAPWEHLRLEFPAPLLLMLSPPQFPSKNRLVTVAEFFAYSEREGRWLAGAPIKGTVHSMTDG